MLAIGDLSRFINHWIERFLFGIGLAMALVVAVQVFCRYVLNYSLFWSEELARYLLVWLSFLGASVAYYRRAHPGIDVVVTLLPDPLKRSVAVGIHIVSLAFFSIMVWYGCQFSYFVRLQITPALYLPRWIVYVIIPVSGSVLMLHGLSLLLRDLKEMRRGG